MSVHCSYQDCFHRAVWHSALPTTPPLQPAANLDRISSHPNGRGGLQHCSAGFHPHGGLTPAKVWNNGLSRKGKFWDTPSAWASVYRTKLLGVLFPRCSSQLYGKNNMRFEEKEAWVGGRSYRAVSLMGHPVSTARPRCNTITVSMDWASPAVNHTLSAQGSLSPGFWEFSIWHFLLGLNLSSFICLNLLVPKGVWRVPGQAHVELLLLPESRLCATLTISILWVSLILREQTVLNPWRGAQLPPSQLLTLTEQLRAEDKHRQTTKPG